MQRRSIYALLGLLAVVLVTLAALWLAAAPRPASAAGERASGAGNTVLDAVKGAGPVARDDHRQPATGQDRHGLNAASQESTDPRESLEVLVVNEEGDPVQDADVRSLSDWDPERLTDQQRHEYAADLADAEWLTTRFGRTLEPNASGIVRLDRPSRDAIVTARHEGTYGVLRLDYDAWPPLTLTLVPDHTLTVRVSDAAGRPRPGVPVVLRWQLEGQERVRPRRLGLTDDDGHFDVRHAQDLLRFLSISSRNVVEVSLGVSVPGIEVPAQKLGLDDLTSEAIDIEIPETGRVEVVFARGDEPWTKAGAALAPFVDEAPSVHPEEWFRASAAPGGPARVVFPDVGLGQRFRLSGEIDGRETVSQDVVSPRVAGETLLVTLSTVETQPVLTAELVQGEGVPLANAEIELSVHTEKTGRAKAHTAAVKTDSEGFLEAPLPSWMSGSTLSRVSMERVDGNEGKTGERADLDTEKRLEPGINELGRVGLEEAPLVVSGRLIHLPERTRMEPRISVELEDATQTREPLRWRRVPDLAVVYDHYGGSGDFRIHGTTKPGNLRLVVQNAQCLPSEPVYFVSGREGLSVTLEKGGMVQVQAIVDHRMPESMIRFELVPSAGADAQGQHASHPWRIARDRVRSRWDGLPPGEYDLRVRVLNAPEPVLTLPRIVVPPGAHSTDSRLSAIDLTPLLRTVTISVRDPGGRPCDGGHVYLRTPSRLEGFPIQGGEALLPLRPPSLDAVVSVEGHPPVELRDIDASVTVDLEEPILVYLETNTDVGLPRGLDLSLRLVPLQPEDEAHQRWVQYEGGWLQGGTRSYQGRLPEQAPLVVRDGVGLHAARITVPGEYAVRASLEQDSTSRRAEATPVDGVAPRTISVLEEHAGDSYEISFQDNALVRALERMGFETAPD